MAIIGKIRERSGLLVALVGGALVLFILDALLSNRGGGRGAEVLGEANGHEIGVVEFENRVDQEVEGLKLDFRNQATAQLSEQVRSSAWNEVIRSLTVLNQAEEAGFSVTRGEYDDIRWGANIAPDLKGIPFLQTDGQIDPAKVKEWFATKDANWPNYYPVMERRLLENRLYGKYTTLVKKSVFVNSAEARDEFAGKNTRATFSFVAKRYDSEADSLYAVSDQDLRRFHDQHKNDRKYRQKASRSFDYVLFPVKPSESDRAAFQDRLAKLRTDLEASTNDSAFVLANADTRSYSVVPFKEGVADAKTDSLIASAAVGGVVGPYAEGDVWKLVKVKEVAVIPEVRVRHILFGNKDAEGKELSEDELKKKKARADSVVAVLRRDRSKFDEMNTKFTEDPGGKSNGGDYGFFDKDKSFVQEFKDAGFDNPKGWMGVVKTQFGYHLIEVMEKRDRSEKRVITVDRLSKPSPATFNEVYKQANEFSLAHKTPEAIKAAADEMGLTVTNVDDFQVDGRYVQGLQQPTSTISWVNRAEVGDVSDPRDSGDNWVVAVLRSIKEEGAPELEDMRDQFTAEVVKEKKAEAYLAKMKGKTDLNALATEMGASVQTATDMLYNVFSIPGGTGEFEVIGKIFALSNGQTSVPLKGDGAVYVVSMTNRTDAPEPADPAGDRSSMLSRLQARAENGVTNALREAAGVVDKRYLIY
ncbi:MAG: peptidylprolyl isomerase [Flavobacteriales bacterium]|nr:peptidylprolyl isomerase [Flavobacteriales bacterium]